jgi:FlaA1/EpsC-like NDP-sugar epimerase
MDYLLVVCGTIGLRSLGRRLYQVERYYRPGPSTTCRRVLVFGAGQDGLEAVLSMQRLAHTEVLGFLDDDVAKHECSIGGYRVLGSSDNLTEVLRKQAISDLVICAHAAPSFRLESIRERCRSEGIRVHSFRPVEDSLTSETA